MSYPVGPLLQTLAKRILVNLDLIDAEAPKVGDFDQDRAPYSDTQLLISLLGVLVFPHARTPEALGKLLCEYGNLASVITIRHSAGDTNAVELTAPDGTRETVDPRSIEGLPRVLRNSIAHFNVRPIDRDGRFGGVRIWNEDDADQITFVADLEFAELRPLARGILTALAEARSDLDLDDPDDPLEVLARQNSATVELPRKAPRITDHVWDRILAAHAGNYDHAKTFVDRVLQRELKTDRRTPA